MLACTKSNFSNFKFKYRYLRKNELLRKTNLACLSGAQMCSINEKNRGRKSRDIAPSIIKNVLKNLIIQELEFFILLQPTEKPAPAPKLP